MAAHQEIERKFLVTGDGYKQQASSQSRVVQGYISSARGRTVRVRIRDGRGYLTIKGASNASGTTRYEWERELPLEEAEELMRLCEPGIIDKVRYLVPCGGHTFEVDEFHGGNQGLVVAEVELSREDEPFSLENHKMTIIIRMMRYTQLRLNLGILTLLFLGLFLLSILSG